MQVVGVTLVRFCEEENHEGKVWTGRRGLEVRCVEIPRWLGLEGDMEVM